MRGAGVVQATRNSWVRRMSTKEVRAWPALLTMRRAFAAYCFAFCDEMQSGAFPKGRGRFAHPLMHPSAGIAGAQLPE